MTTNYNFVVKNGLVVRGADASTSTNTGAVIIAGGVGIGGALHATEIYEGAYRVLTSASLGNFGVSAIYAGTGTAISTSTGAVTIWATGGGGGGSLTLQQVTDYGSTTTNALSITNTSTSFGTNSGALVVAGGVGIGNNLYIGQAAFINGAEVVTSATLNNYVIQTNILAGTDTVVSTSTGDVYIWNTSSLQSVTDRGSVTSNNIEITDPTSSTSTNSGALIVAGGVGVGGSLYASALYDSGSRVVTENSIGNFGVSSITAGTGTSISSSTGNITVWSSNNLQTVTDQGSETSNSVSITSISQSINTNSGQALLVSGGIGAQLVSASQLFDNGNRVVTSVTPTSGAGIGVSALISTGSNVSFEISNFGVREIFGNGQITVSSTTGSVTISLTSSTTSTYLSLNITGEDDSTSPTTGALTVAGGVGVGKSITIGNTATVNGTFYRSGNITAPDWMTKGIAFVSSTATFTATSLTGLQGPVAINAFGVPTLASTQSPIYSDASTVFISGAPIAGSGVTITNPWSLYVANGNVKVAAATVSSSPTTGALVVTGGVGVGGNLNVTGTGSFDTNGVTIGSALVSSYSSNVISIGGVQNLDAFSTSTYRTARYTVQIVDGSKIHVSEMTVFHDNVLVYKNEYGISTNLGELGTFDANLTAGTVTLTFTPNYTPSSMKIKATRTALTS